MNQIKERFRKELLESCVPFWLNHAIDTQYGGLINCLDREGKVYSTDKSIWMQGRAAWMFSYLYNNIEKKRGVFEIGQILPRFSGRSRPNPTPSPTSPIPSMANGSATCAETANPPNRPAKATPTKAPSTLCVCSPNA